MTGVFTMEKREYKIVVCRNMENCGKKMMSYFYFAGVFAGTKKAETTHEGLLQPFDSI